MEIDQYYLQTETAIGSRASHMSISSYFLSLILGLLSTSVGAWSVKCFVRRLMWQEKFSVLNVLKTCRFIY